MEKRNFVTSKRSYNDFHAIDDIVDAAAAGFGVKSAQSGLKAKSATEFAKKASAEDEKTDLGDQS